MKVILVIFLLILLAPSLYAQNFQIQLGPEEIVFDWSSQKCDNEDIPDSPARAFRDSDGKIQLISTHYVNRRFIGDSLDSVSRDCNIVFNSSLNSDPSQYNYKEWLVAPYTFDGNTVYSLVHNEFLGHDIPGFCAIQDPSQWIQCWYNAITLAVSNNKGQTYTQSSPPVHLIASVPYTYSQNPSGAYGFFEPSNIIKKDNYYYSFLHVEPYGSQNRGTCLMRTDNLADSSSWRFWNGNGFNNAPINPYTQQNFNPAEHICAIILPAPIVLSNSISYNEYLGKYILVGTSQKYSFSLGREVYGFYYSLSNDLVTWSERELLMEAKLPWDPLINIGEFELYPSLLEETSSRNFEITRQQPYLYYTRKNSNPGEPTFDRDLIRRRLIFVFVNSSNQPINPPQTNVPENASNNNLNQVENYIEETFPNQVFNNSLSETNVPENASNNNLNQVENYTGRFFYYLIFTIIIGAIFVVTYFLWKSIREKFSYKKYKNRSVQNQNINLKKSKTF